MPAAKTNYLVLYAHDPQVYGSGSKEIAMSSPPPKGFSIEDKRVYFVTVEPDAERLVWHRVPQEEVEAAELVYPKPKKKKDEVDEEG